MVIVYMEKLAVILDLEIDVAVWPLAGRMLGPQETSLPVRAKKVPLELGSARAFGIEVAVAAPLWMDSSLCRPV